MKTGNFDVVFEVNEELINKGLAALFYSGFLFKKGTWKPKTEKLPASIQNLAEVAYEVRLKGEPVIDVLTDKKIRVLATAEAFLVLFEGYELEFDINLGLEGTVAYDKATDKIILDLTELHLSQFTVDNKSNLPDKPFKAVNEILKQVVTENLTKKWEVFDMKNPLVLAKLPKMPDGDAYKVPVRFGGLKTFNNNVLAACFNILENDGGDIAAVQNFIGKNSYAAGINEDAMHRLLNFWWEHTTFEKTIAKDKTYYFPVAAQYMNFIANVFDIGVQLATLGFVETDINVEEVWVEYGAAVTLPKPEFDLKEGNKLELKNYAVTATVYARAKAKISTTVTVDSSGGLPDWMTPWEDDTVIAKKTSVITLFPPPPLESLSVINMAVDTSAAGSVVLNAENELEAKIDALNLHVDFGPEWYKNLPEYVINDVIIALLKELALSKLNSFLIFPAVIVKQIPKTGFNLSVDLNLLDVDEQELFVAADIDVKELQPLVQPVPKYIANKNPRAKEVHRNDCISVQRMNEANKVGYYTLYDAFRDGYDGCKDCIPEYHKR